MIKISLNKELDYEVYADFWDFSVAGADFGGMIKKDHFDISLENYKKYIDDFYLTNQAKIINKQVEINELLNKKQSKFLLALKDIFHMDFSDDVYQGYISIFNCNPRYLETKTFQIFHKKDLPHMSEVAFHESLHFAFFDYLDINFSEKIKGLDKNSGILWEMSEIFNVIVLNLPSFRETMEIEEKLFYPELQDKLDKAKEIWNSCDDVKKFVNEYLNNMRYLYNQNKTQIEITPLIFETVKSLVEEEKNKEFLIKLRDLMYSKIILRPYTKEVEDHEKQIRWKRTSSEILADGYVYAGKSCTDLAILFIGLCNALNLETRFVKVRKDKMVHSVVEIKLPDGWYVFDVSGKNNIPEKTKITEEKLWNGWQLWKKGRDAWGLGLVDFDSISKIHKMFDEKNKY